MTADTGRNLYEQARDLGWSRDRAARVAGVALTQAETWEAKWDAVVARIKERKAAPVVSIKAKGPTFIGNPETIPRGDREKV